MRAHKNSWYREWHQCRHSHHFHVAMLVIYLASIILGSLGSFLTIPPKNALASTVYDWNLNTPSEYTYNPDEIEFVGGVVQPKRDHFIISEHMYDTYFFNANMGYVVGGDGAILKTTDGGTNWIIQTSGTSLDLHNIYCVNVDTCYTVGGEYSSNIILKTTNGGTNWIAQSSAPGVTAELYGISCPSTDTCYTTSRDAGKILKTTNGGTNWIAQDSGGTYLYDIACTDVDTCYAISSYSNSIRKTTNGGTSWTNQTPGYYYLYSISCIDANNCYAAGASNSIRKTTDGGTNWTTQTAGTGNNLYSIFCTDVNICYTSGTNGTLLKTTNGGINWIAQTSGTTKGIRGIYCADANTCYTGGGDASNEPGPILKTTNGGTEWMKFNYIPETPTVVPKTSQDYSVITNFTETLGEGSEGYISYQVSNDNGATWYWYEVIWGEWGPIGGSWTLVTPGYQEYWGNTANDLNARISTFMGNYNGGTGKFKWKAILRTTYGVQVPILDNVQISIAQRPNIPESLTISDVSNMEKGVWALALSWDLPEPGGEEIDFYKIERSDNGGAWHETGRTSDGTKRAYAEVVDSNSITYSYRVRSVDHDDIGNLYDNESEPSNEVSMIPTGKFPSPPSLLGAPSVSVTATSANITWSTDRVSSSTAKYGTDTNYGLIASDNQTAVTSHFVSLKGLLPGTTYHYQMQSLDPERTYGDVYYQTDYTFTTTLAAEISDLKVTDIRSDNALLSWQTTSDMTSTVYYGKTAEYGLSVEASGGTSHTLKLTGLEDSTTYHLKIAGKDAGGNLVQSDDYSFETLAFPRVSNVRFEPIKDRPSSTLRAVWDTNIPTSSVVEYTDSEGNKKAISEYQLVTKHEIILSGLKDKAIYTMVAKGRDAFGNEASSESQKITTDIDTRPPKISEITVETSIDGYGANAKSQMIVSWSTDELATSQVEYSKGGSGKKLDMTTQEDYSLTTSHAVIISGLDPSSSYYFRIITKDGSRNETKSEINSAITDQIRLSVFDIILKSFESTLGWLFGVEGFK